MRLEFDLENVINEEYPRCYLSRLPARLVFIVAEKNNQHKIVLNMNKRLLLNIEEAIEKEKEFISRYRI